MKNRFARAGTFLLVVAFFSVFGSAYSVLTHEQVVDLLWKNQIQPLLLKRFPSATEDDLAKAHAYAYGGSLIQDMGYYPFGSKFFSDLVHYVRSGDFVQALLRDSYDVNEYAFALGALSHYAADNSGHPAINQVVAIVDTNYGSHGVKSGQFYTHFSLLKSIEGGRLATSSWPSPQFCLETRPSLLSYETIVMVRNA